jgi:hypothetical protein
MAKLILALASCAVMLGLAADTASANSLLLGIGTGDNFQLSSSPLAQPGSPLAPVARLYIPPINPSQGISALTGNASGTGSIWGIDFNPNGTTVYLGDDLLQTATPGVYNFWNAASQPPINFCYGGSGFGACPFLMGNLVFQSLIQTPIQGSTYFDTSIVAELYVSGGTLAAPFAPGAGMSCTGSPLPFTYIGCGSLTINLGQAPNITQIPVASPFSANMVGGSVAPYTPLQPVPEVATLAMVSSGLLALAVLQRKFGTSLHLR